MAPTATVLLIARGVQGLGGALMAASSLAIITSSFAAGPERHRAVALWGAMNGLGGAIGVLASGAITEWVSWRWVLLINVPIGIVTAIVAAGVVARRVSAGRPKLDLLGAFVLTVGLLISAYGGVTAGTDGWGSAAALVPLGIGTVLMSLFPLVEKRATAPLVPPGALTPALRAINVVVLLFSAAIFPMWFLGSLYLQQVLSLSPITTGLCFLPMTLVIFACASQGGKLVSRAGVKPVLVGGLIMLAAGMALFGRINQGGSPIQYVILPGILTAIGIGFSVVSSTIAAVQSAAPEQAGFASGLVNTSRQVGGSLGLAILISVATQYTSHLVGHSQPIEQALTNGFRLAYLGCAVLVAAAAVAAFVLIPRREAPSQRLGTRFLTAAAAAVLVFAAIDFGVPRSHAAAIGAYTTKGAYTFVSAPGLHPPELSVEQAASQPLPGYVMTTSFYDLTQHPMVGQSGPLILDSNLNPVWFEPVPTSEVADNLEAQSYKGQRVLSYWRGEVTPTGLINKGEDVVLNDHYQTIATLRATGGWVLTMHEFAIRGDDAWVTANRNVSADLSPDGGVNHGVMVDSAVQEYNLATGKLVYSWDARDHIPPTDSHAQPPANGFPWDAYHVNSIDPLPNGTFLVSMRNTWAAYLVNERTGKIIWELGGKHSSFTIPTDALFQWQHDVMVLKPGVISLFDDACCDITGAGQYLAPNGPSRALFLGLNASSHTATALGGYEAPTKFSSEYMGNVQVLSNGNVFIGWGDAPYMTEYSKGGKLLFEGIFPTPDISYRTYVERWVGLPLTKPSAAARTTGGHTTVYASWNGATELQRWRVIGISSGGVSKVLATQSTDGFETSFPVPSGYRSFRVQALGAGGKLLSTSATFNAHQ